MEYWPQPRWGSRGGADTCPVNRAGWGWIAFSPAGGSAVSPLLDEQGDGGQGGLDQPAPPDADDDGVGEQDAP
eukprot:2503798-Amphidinium_carterae.1